MGFSVEKPFGYGALLRCSAIISDFKIEVLNHIVLEHGKVV